MWGIIKKAINSTVGKGMKTLDRISKEDTSQIIYEIARIMSESGVLPSESVVIVPKTDGIPYQFLRNNSLVTNVIVPPEVKTISLNAINDCPNIKHLYLPNVEIIRGSSLKGNGGLTTVTLGKKLRSIDGQAFQGDGSLTDIFYEGTISEWQRIPKGSNWDNNTGDYTVHCIDGDISK